MSRSQASTCCHAKISILNSRNGYKFCQSRIGAILQLCLKLVPGTNKEQNAKAGGNLGKISYFPLLFPVCGPRSGEKAGTAKFLCLETAASPQALPRLQAGLGWAKVSGRGPPVPLRQPARWKAEPNGQGRQPGSAPGSKGPEPDPRPAPTVLSTAGTARLAEGSRALAAPCTLTQPALGTRRLRGSDLTPTIQRRRPASPPTWQGLRPLAPASHPAARQHPRRCQADTHLGARERVCVAAGKCETGSSGCSHYGSEKTTKTPAGAPRASPPPKWPPEAHAPAAAT